MEPEILVMQSTKNDHVAFRPMDATNTEGIHWRSESSGVFLAGHVVDLTQGFWTRASSVSR
jgi:hypothetical protein